MSVADKVPIAGIWSILLLTWLQPLPMPAALQPVNLRCAQRVNPEGIGDTAPRLSWELQRGSQGTTSRGEMQSALVVSGAFPGPAATARSQTTQPNAIDLRPPGTGGPQVLLRVSSSTAG